MEESTENKNRLPTKEALHIFSVAQRHSRSTKQSDIPGGFNDLIIFLLSEYVVHMTCLNTLTSHL